MFNQRHENPEPGKSFGNDMKLPLSGVSILVAEDAFDNQLLIRTILRGCGAEVEVANNGREAVDAALSATYDVVLMDLQMPLMDGYEATRTLRKAGYTRPIIALTAHAMVEERRRTLEAGCNHHLTKPLNVPELIATIHHSISEMQNTH